MAWIYFLFIFESLTNYCDVVRRFSSWFWLLIILSSLLILECCWHVDLDMSYSYLFCLCFFLIWNLFFLVLVWARLFFFKSSMFRIPFDTVALLGWWTWIVFLWSCLRISLFPSSILKYSCIGYSSLGWQLLSRPEIYCFMLSRALGFLLRGLIVSLHLPLQMNWCFLLQLLIFFVCTFGIWTIMWHGEFVPRPCLFVLGYSPFPWMFPGCCYPPDYAVRFQWQIRSAHQRMLSEGGQPRCRTLGALPVSSGCPCRGYLWHCSARPPQRTHPKSFSTVFIIGQFPPVYCYIGSFFHNVGPWWES